MFGDYRQFWGIRMNQQYICVHAHLYAFMNMCSCTYVCIYMYKGGEASPGELQGHQELPGIHSMPQGVSAGLIRMTRAGVSFRKSWWFAQTGSFYMARVMSFFTFYKQPKLKYLGRTCGRCSSLLSKTKISLWAVHFYQGQTHILNVYEKKKSCT